jgi:hypothetical protein
LKTEYDIIFRKGIFMKLEINAKST